MKLFFHLVYLPILYEKAKKAKTKTKTKKPKKKTRQEKEKSRERERARGYQVNVLLIFNSYPTVWLQKPAEK